MTRQDARASTLAAYNQARAQGLASQRIAAEVGLSERTLRRWADPDNPDDRRPSCSRKTPVNALSPEEKARVLDVCNQPAYASLPPAQIVAELADKGEYLASESTFYRILRQKGLQHHRGRARAPAAKAPPPRHSARAPAQVWVWDITWLPATVRGQFLKLYLLMDLFSRKFVAWEVHHEENAEHSEDLLRRACLAEGAGPGLVVHGDNGSPFKAATLLAKMQALGVTPSHSRPRVSNDNAHAEAAFRTLKYHPSYPPDGFKSLLEAREWTESFVDWYNNHHRHKSIGCVTPAQKHAGKDLPILEARRTLYEKMRSQNPGRWINGRCRAWKATDVTHLNPINIRTLERDLKNVA